jgi:purine-binding chemotaxis protein CheW
MSVSEILELDQYLSFTIGDEIYALDIMKVREVLVYTKITKVPCTPAYMLGVINLRGSIVPVIDISLKFGMMNNEKITRKCIIIIEVIIENEELIIGALVDSVQEVFELEKTQIEPPPKFATTLHSEFITGMGKYDDKLIIILDINKMFSSEELSLLGNYSEG